MAVKLKCPGCKSAFPWDTTAGWPRFCPLCSYDTSMDDNPEVAAPHIGTLKGKSGDQVYRQMEQASERRVEAAAEMAGVDKSEMSSLKITNLRDNLRTGDIAAMPVVNDVSRAIDQAPSHFGFQSNQSAAAEYASSAHAGPYPYAGARAKNMVRAMHARSGETVTDLPAREVVNQSPKGM